MKLYYIITLGAVASIDKKQKGFTLELLLQETYWINLIYLNSHCEDWRYFIDTLLHSS